MKKIYSACIIFLFAFECHAKVSAVIERWDTRLSLKKGNDLVITQFLRVKILDEDGYAHSVFRDYYDSFRKITSLRAVVYDPAGKRVKKLGKSDALDIMLNPSYEIGDMRMLILDPKYRNFPFTIEIETETNYNGFLSFPRWMPRYAHNLEVKAATLSLECYESFQFRHRTFNGVQDAVETSLPGMKQIVWQVKDLPAVSKQVNHKAFLEAQPYVYLAPLNFTLDNKNGSFNTWQDFGDWFLELNAGRNTLSDETRSYLNTLRARNVDTRELIGEVYRFMQRKTRYISIQLGIGGFQSIPADEVERTNYGDCKALTNYMKAMLDHLEIPCNYILVSAGEDAPDILSDLPSNQFNHVFLAAPLATDTVWLECTSQISPASYIGTFTDDRHVLWLERGKSKIINTPAYTPAVNKRFTQCNAVINDRGDATLSVIRTHSGAYFNDLLACKSMSAGQVAKVNNTRFDYKDFRIESFVFEQPKPDEPVAYFKYEIKANGIAKKLGDKMIVPVNILPSIDMEIELDPVARQSEIRRSFTLHDNVEIKVPDNFRVESIPVAIEQTFDFGTFEIKAVSRNENAISIQRKITMNKGFYEGAAFDRFYETIKKIRSLDQAKIILLSKT